MSFQRWVFSSSRRLFFDDDNDEDDSKIDISRTLPNLYWLEKFLLVLDYFQMFGLLWINAQPWGMPYLFSLYTKPLLYANLDFFSLGPTGPQIGNVLVTKSRWGHMDGYLYYAALFSLIQFAVFAVIFYCRYAQDTFHQSMRKASFGKSLIRFDSLIMGLLVISEVLYIPCCLSVFRLWQFESIAGEYVLSADPTVTKQDTEWKVIVAVCTFFCVTVCIGLPMMLHGYVSRVLIYKDRLDHEKRIQIWELMYMLQVDTNWLQKQLWVTSSFRLFGAFFRRNMLVLKLVLLCISIGLRFDYIAQSTLFTACVGVFTVCYIFWRMPYRSLSSNFVFIVAFSLLLTNCCFAMANAYGVENAVMVASSQAYFLFAANGLGIMLIVAIVLVFSSFTTLGANVDFPCMKTLVRIMSDRALEAKVAYWVEMMKEALSVKNDFISSPVEVADVSMLEESIRLLRTCWVSAKVRGSIFETPLAEMIEDLVRIHASRLPKALRKFSHWDKAYMEAAKGDAFSKRERKYRILEPLRRRILLKLLAVRFIKGDRDLGSFNLELGKKHSKLLRRLEDAKKRRDEKRNALIKSRDGMTMSSKLGLQDNAKVKVMGFKLFELNAKSLIDGLESAVPPMPAQGVREVALENEFDDAERELDDLEMEVEEQGEAAHGERIAREEARRKAKEAAKAAALAKVEANPTDWDHDHNPEDERKVGMQGSEEGDEEGDIVFTQAEIDGSAAMMATLKQRTELVLSKYHHASVAIQKSIKADQWASGSDAGKFTSFKVLKETIEPEEQNDLESLYLLWDEAIQLYEDGQFPGDPDDLLQDCENWYTYRGLISERLELVMNILAEKQFDIDEDLDAEEVIEEGGEDFSDRSSEVDFDHSDEDEDEDEDHPLLQKYQLSKKFPTLSSLQHAENGEGSGEDIERGRGGEEED